MAENRRQLEQAITDGFDRDLHPDHLAGQNLGPRSDEGHRAGRTVPERGEIRATGDMQASADDAFVVKDQVPYPTWNRLRGIDDPQRTGADSHRNG
jgi:hypothetical protein